MPTWEINFKHDHCTEVHLTRSLNELGHDVVSLQEDAVSAAQVFEHAYGCDALIYTRTWSVTPPDGIFDVLVKLPKVSVRTIGFHLDLFWPLPRRELVRTDPMFRCQTVFTADGGYEAAWRDAGVNHVWLPPGVLKAECVPGNPSAERWQGYDVAFVGSARYHPEWRHRGQLIYQLSERYGSRFLKVGDGRPTVRGSDLNDLYATVPVIVGDSLLYDGAKSRYWSDRVPETLGRGGYLLHPLVYEVGAHYGAHAPRAWELDDWEMMHAQIAAMLEDGDARNEAIEAAQPYVRDHHSYTERAATLLRKVFG